MTQKTVLAAETTKRSDSDGFKLTAALVKWFQTHGFKLVCENCDNALKIGDTIISRKRVKYNGDCYTVHYHKRCWQGLFH